MNEPSLNKNAAEKLYAAMLKLKTPKEVKFFLRDLCTLSEIEAMIGRFQVVKMINENKPYRKISKDTGASTATITRVAHWLHHGMGGYRLVLDRLKR